MESSEKFTIQPNKFPDHIDREDRDVKSIEDVEAIKLTSAETLEIQKRIEFKVTDEIIQYRFRNEIRNKVENLAKTITDNLNNNKLASFNKYFQCQYIDFKLKIATLADDFKDFLEQPEDVKKDKLIEKISNEKIFVDASQIIKIEMEDYIKQSQSVKKYIENYNSEEVFRNIIGESPKGLIEICQNGNALIVHTYDNDDYAKLHGGKKNDALLSSGFFQSNRQIKNGENEISSPLIVINSKISDDLYFELANVYQDEYFDEYMKQSWEELTEKKLYDEDTGDEIKEHFAEFDEWSSNPPKKYSMEAFILDKLEFSDQGDFDYDLMDKIVDWKSENENILCHEKQHHVYHRLIFEQEDKDHNLSLGIEQVREYLQDIYKHFTKDLGNEIIAFLVEKDFYLYNKSEDDNDDDEEDEEYYDDNDKKKKSHKIKNGHSVKLPNKLYFFSRLRKKAIFEIIKKEIGKEKFKEFNIENMWKEYVAEPFAKKKKQLEKIGGFFLKKIHKEELVNSKRILGLLEVEPVESWPRLYYWFRNNPNLFGRISK